MKVNKLIPMPVELKITGAIILSAEEAKTLPERLRMYNCWWWLRTPGIDLHFAADVSVDGSVNSGGSTVRNICGMIRPALLLEDLEASDLSIGDCFIFSNIEFEVVSDNLAFCKADIGNGPFNRRECIGIIPSAYDTSDLKKYVDSWFFNECEKSRLTTEKEGD